MAYIDNVKAVRVRAEKARADMNVLVKQLEDALYTVARPLPAISWMTDDVLHLACNSFAMTAVQQTITPQPPLIDPGRELTYG